MEGRFSQFFKFSLCPNLMNTSFGIFVENEKKVHFSTFRFHNF